MSRNDLENKNWLANSIRNFRKRNDSPENFVRQSLANITRVARINSLKKSRLRKRKGQKGPRKSRKIKGAKVTRIFLATSKYRATNTSKIARMTNLTKF